MERPRGLEPPPTAWQAVVLPLYYGRFGVNLLYSMALQARTRAPGAKHLYAAIPTALHDKDLKKQP